MSTPRPLDDNAIKHLEFIQSVIARLANDSFLMKGWGLTVSGAFFGFSAHDLDWRIGAVGLLPVLAFWYLDGYFLSRERMYRRLYDAVRRGEPNVEPFSMDYRAFHDHGSWWDCEGTKTTWWCSVRSRTLWSFYSSILLVGIVVIVAGATHHTP